MNTICGAKLRNKNELCQATQLMSNGKCRLHGGKTPKGIASPNFKDGKHSKYTYLPERLSEKVAEFMNNPEIIELKENIAVLDTRLTELYQQFHKTEPAEVWQNLAFQYEQWQTELKLLDSFRDDKEKERQKSIIADCQKSFAKLLKEGASEQSKAESLWREILFVTEQRRKLAESESKRMKDAQQFITAEQFLSFVQMVQMVIKNNISDQSTLNKISSAFYEQNIITNRIQ